MDNEAPAIIDQETKSMPSERFASAGEVREICQLMIHADRPRALQRATVQGIIDGNRPYRQASMTKNAQGWRANVNFREAEGVIQSNRTPYYDLVTEVDPCIQIEIDYGRGDQASEWAGIIEQAFHRMVFGWESFDWHIQLQQSEMITHGWGSHLWMSGHDWRCRTKTMRNVLFPNGSTSDLEDLDLFVVRDPQKASQLWQSIRNEGAARSVGWLPDKVKDALVQSSKEDDERHRQPEAIQAALKRGDLGYSYARSKEVVLNHVFVREFDGGKNDQGGISHYIIVEGGDEYLYKRRHRFDAFSNVLAFFPYDIGSEGTIHSIRGLGARVYPFMELSNRLKNTMADNVIMSSGILLSQSGSPDLTKMQLTSLGPMKMLPAGVSVADYKFPGLENGPLALSRELQETQQENTKTYRQGIDSTSRERTAFEVQVNQSDSARLEKSAHNMYYRNLDRFYTEMLRRATNPNITTTHPGGKEAVAFQNACLRAGVPKEALAKICDVQAARSIGAGSASQRLTSLQMLMQNIYPTANDVSRNHIQRDFCAALVGQNKVDRYVPQIDRAAIATDDDAIAVLENDALINGGEAIVTQTQNHLRHAGRHMQKAGQLLDSIKQGGDPRQVLAAWEAMGPHIAQHMTFLEQDPTRKMEFKSLHQQFEMMSKFADQLLQHIQEQDQAQAEQQANQPQGQQPQAVGPFGDPELDMQWQAMQAKNQLDFAKLQGQLALKKAKQESDTRLKDDKAAADMQRQNARTRADIAAKAAAAASQNGSLPYARGGSTE